MDIFAGYFYPIRRFLAASGSIEVYMKEALYNV